jgi:hypothetical protein
VLHIEALSSGKGKFKFFSCSVLPA